MPPPHYYHIGCRIAISPARLYNPARRIRLTVPDITIIRSSRRTVSLEVTHSGEVVVRAPRRLSHSVIHNLLKEKEHWITEKLELMRRRRAERPSPRYVEGESFLHLGASCPLHIDARRRPVLELADGRFILAATEQWRAPQLFERWYRQRARLHFGERTAHWAQRGGFTVHRVRVSGAVTKWGPAAAAISTSPGG